MTSKQCKKQIFSFEQPENILHFCLTIHLKFCHQLNHRWFSFQLINSTTSTNEWEKKSRMIVVKLTTSLLAVPCTSDPRLSRTCLYSLLQRGTTPLLFEAGAKKFSSLANTVGEITWQTKHNRLTRYTNTHRLSFNKPFSFVDCLLDSRLLPLT